MHFPRPSSSAVPAAPQHTVGMLVTYIQLAADQNPQIPFCGAALQPLVLQPVQRAKVALSQVQGPTLPLVELHVLGDGPAL